MKEIYFACSLVMVTGLSLFSQIQVIRVFMIRGYISTGSFGIRKPRQESW